ncbi:MAG: MliC family protein [Paracoccus sp. (in: a-proteobacteria)]
MHLPILTLCLSLPAAWAQAEIFTVDYTCADNRTLQAAFINEGEANYAVLLDADRLVPMTIAQSGSGARYLSEDGKLELWTKGPEATLRRVGDEEVTLYQDCQEAPAAE